MKTDFSLTLCCAVAAVAACVEVLYKGAHGNVATADVALFAAVVAVVILALRLHATEKRIGALEERLNGQNKPGDKPEDDTPAGESTDEDETTEQKSL